MLPALFLTSLLLLPPPDTTPPTAACVVTVQEMASSDISEYPPSIANPASRRLAWEVWGVEYLRCEVDADNVKEIVFSKEGTAIATLSSGERVPFSSDSKTGAWLAAYAASKGVTVSSAAAPNLKIERKTRSSSPMKWWQMSLFWGCLILVVGVCVVRYRRFHKRAKVAASGSSGASTSVKRGGTPVPETRFSDVAGCKEAIEDLREIVDVLKNPERFGALGARAPKGALLVGPPGTGKTLLARAVAGEAGVPFFSAAGSDFVEMYVGVGARRVRDVFEKAKKAGRAIVFIDEIDAVGRKRGENSTTGGETEHENTLIALLNELDGFQSSNVVVLAATNRPDVLDPALCRPGRLDRRVHVGLPDVVERAQILGVHTTGKPLGEGVSLEAVARRTAGMSGAQLEHVCNEAALIAARSAAARVEQHHLFEAVEYVAMGRPRRSSTVTAEDREVTAWHEAGHAVVALKHPHADPPIAVSIVPRGQAGGVTWMATRDTQILSRSDLRARLVVALGGRAAEEVLLNGEYTAGAASDLAQATEIAQAMVDRFGMTDRGLSVRPLGSDDSSLRVDVLLAEALGEARGLLNANLDLVKKMVQALLEQDDLDEAGIAALCQPSVTAP